MPITNAPQAQSENIFIRSGRVVVTYSRKECWTASRQTTCPMTARPAAAASHWTGPQPQRRRSQAPPGPRRSATAAAIANVGQRTISCPRTWGATSRTSSVAASQ